MNWEAPINEFLQKLSGGFFDALFLTVTELGGEIALTVAAALFYLCGDKRYAFKFLNVYFIGAFFRLGLNKIIARPRPYAAYPDRIKLIGKAPEGYSFPSGHAYTAANMAAQLSMRYKDARVRVATAAAVALVALSRLYLGVHYLTDVIAGTAMGAGLAAALSPPYDLAAGDGEERLSLILFPLTVILAAAFNADKLVLSLCGIYGALLIGYYLQKRFVRFDAAAKTPAQALKLAVALGAAFAIKEGLKFILPANILLLSEYLRYFAAGFWISFIFPWVISKTAFFSAS